MTTTLDTANPPAEAEDESIDILDDADVDSDDDQTGAAGVDDDATASEDDDGAAGPIEPLAAIAPPPEPIPLPVPREVPGLIRGLAEMLASTKGTLILAIAKLSEDQLLITIQPPPPEGDTIATLPPLQVKGSPAELDEKLLDALSHYVPAVEFATKTAAQIASETAAIATAARTSATAKRTSTPSKPAARAAVVKTTRLTVRAKPRAASLTLVDAAEKSHDIEVGKPISLPRGKVTITASAEGFEQKSKTLSLTSVTQVTTIELNSNVGTLSIKATPKAAAVSVVDANGASRNVELRTKTKLTYGKYTVTVGAPGYESQTLTATVGSTPTALDVTLIERPPGLFEGTELS